MTICTKLWKYLSCAYGKFRHLNPNAQPFNFRVGYRRIRRVSLSETEPLKHQYMSKPVVRSTHNQTGDYRIELSDKFLFHVIQGFSTNTRRVKM
jgi:hypothetical protein